LPKQLSGMTVASVKIPLLSLLDSLSVILKIQTDETQLKMNRKENSFFF